MLDPRLQGFSAIPEMLVAYGVYTQWPRFTFPLDCGKLVFKLNRSGKNAGGASIDFDGVWMGSIMTDGTLRPNRDMRALDREAKVEIWTLLSKLRANAEETFAEIGKQSGTCCMCARPLTDEESVARGMGPICAGRIFG